MADTVKTLNGVYKATVVDINDPQKQNRIKVTLQFYNTPLGSTQKPLSTDWIPQISAPGLNLPAPAIGQGVWVMFQSGDPSHPVWMGSFGKWQAPSKKVLIKPLLNTVSLSGITDLIIVVTNQDGTQEIDLVATLLAMANRLKNHEERITSLESQMAGKASTSHSHPGL
jgi:hypothetical protein